MVLLDRHAFFVFILVTDVPPASLRASLVAILGSFLALILFSLGRTQSTNIVVEAPSRGSKSSPESRPTPHVLQGERGIGGATMPVPSHFNSVEAIKIHCYMVSQPKSAEKGVTPEEVRLKRIPPILLLLKDAYEAHLSFLKPLLKSGRLFGSSCFG